MEEEGNPEVYTANFQETTILEENRVSALAAVDTEKYADKLVKEIERITGGYVFRDRMLLLQAFTHPSYGGEDCPMVSNERLEFVGDSVLNLMITNELYFLYPNMQPGQLTRLRAANVDNEKLARVAIRHGLHDLLLHDNPLLSRKIEEFRDDIKQYHVHSFGLINTPKGLADAVESLIGALYIDSNSSMETTWKIVKDLVHPIITLETFQVHPVSRLYELCQKHKLTVNVRNHWKKTGEIEFVVGDEIVGRGTYATKRVIAYHKAAQDALDKLLAKLNIERDDS